MTFRHMEVPTQLQDWVWDYFQEDLYSIRRLAKPSWCDKEAAHSLRTNVSTQYPAHVTHGQPGGCQSISQTRPLPCPVLTPPFTHSPFTLLIEVESEQIRIQF